MVVTEKIDSNVEYRAMRTQQAKELSLLLKKTVKWEKWTTEFADYYNFRLRLGFFTHLSFYPSEKNELDVYNPKLLPWAQKFAKALIDANVATNVIIIKHFKT
jgi:hypothetical protein